MDVISIYGDIPAGLKVVQLGVNFVSLKRLGYFVNLSTLIRPIEKSRRARNGTLFNVHSKIHTDNAYFYCYRE